LLDMVLSSNLVLKSAEFLLHPRQGCEHRAS
jgi:hypothetical protein